MDKVYFTIIRNHNTKQCSIIGALSGEEERKLVSKIIELENQGIKCDRVSLNLDISINEEIKNNLVGKFTFVPINTLFKGEKFIDFD